MSIYQKKTIVASYPAYDVVTLAPVTNDPEFINLKDDDEIISPNHLSKFKVGSVVGYALSYNEDPIEAYNRAIENKHDLHYIFGLGSSLTAHKRDRKTYIEVKVGQKVIFQGKRFEIVARPNDNRGFKEIK